MLRLGIPRLKNASLFVRKKIHQLKSLEQRVHAIGDSPQALTEHGLTENGALHCAATLPIFSLTAWRMNLERSKSPRSTAASIPAISGIGNHTITARLFRFCTEPRFICVGMYID